MEDQPPSNANSSSSSSFDEDFSWGSSADSSSNDEHDSNEIKTTSVEESKTNPLEFYNCNICLDVASNPVVTFCGHLFCWPCIFCWLYFHSRIKKQCPVCKQYVDDNMVIPIYGRGNGSDVRDKRIFRIPRPGAMRVGSLRESIEMRGNGISFDELVSFLRSRIQSGDFDPESAVCVSILKRFLSSRAIRREHNYVYVAGEMEMNRYRPRSVLIDRCGGGDLAEDGGRN
ncbi:E3 ubiquitin-protein ligase RNF185-like [Impatiens glandulifera]|uniref:E3 ubiquitin-protein ligase RNF185-like n=1 Tax=Impatiens glandulifera TaxID=253017 RepID=UPI001FB0AF32|nr:E3 ubiquitin-protein ligase RNF185-like [Impatiens glandulifera]